MDAQTPEPMTTSDRELLARVEFVLLTADSGNLWVALCKTIDSLKLKLAEAETALELVAVSHNNVVTELESAERERDQMREALRAAKGYLMNAKIDIETNTKKATTMATLDGGIKVVSAAPPHRAPSP